MDRRTPWHRSGSLMAIAMVVMNLATYGYTIVAARLLGPDAFGAFAAVMGLLLVLGVLQLGLQTTGARRVAADPSSVAQVERALLRVSVLASTGLALLCLALAPAFDVLLNLGSLPTALLVAATAFPMTMMGGQAGILQGERRWRPLALLYVSAGLARLLLGTALLLWRPGETTAVLTVAVAFWAPVVVGWWALRRSAGHRPEVADAGHSPRSILTETARNSHALLAFLALSNADIIIARDVLEPRDAGLYAAGLILVKAVLFLPQFVVIVAFPSMSDSQVRRRAVLHSIALVSVIGALCVAATWLLSSLALVFVGGAAYADIEERLWLFAVLGTVVSLLQLLVYSVVARQSRRAVYVVWAGLAAVVVLSRGVGDVTSLLLVVVACDVVVLLVLLLLTARTLDRAAPALPPAEAAAAPTPRG